METILNEEPPELRAKILEGLEEVITTKSFSWHGDDPQEIIEKFKKGEKIPYHVGLYGRVIMVCQNFHMNPDQIDTVLQDIFEPENTEDAQLGN